ARLLEGVERTDMVVVHVRDDHVLHCLGVHTKQSEAFRGVTQECAPPLCGDFGPEAGVHHDGPLPVPDEPYEVVHGGLAVVRVATKEVAASLARARGIADRIHLVWLDMGLMAVIRS